MIPHPSSTLSASERLFDLSCKLAIVRKHIVGKQERDAVLFAINELDAIRLQVFRFECAQTPVVPQ